MSAIYELVAIPTVIQNSVFSKFTTQESETKIFADIIRDELNEYHTIILLGHSMGGLLCKSVLSQLIINNDRGTLSKISGLFLLATPQLGSLKVPRILSHFSSDFKVLKSNNQFITNINTTLKDHLQTNEEIDATIKTIVPTWAILGGADFWVDELSAGIGLNSIQKKTTRGSHTEIVKPKSKNQNEYKWVCQRIKRCAKKYKYDVFIAAVMAGNNSESEFKSNRDDVLLIKDALENNGLSNVYYAGLNITSIKEFEAESLALEDDLNALINSRYFLLYYPKPVMSSVIFEAGIALAHGKPSVYFVTDQKQLPFLMQQIGQTNIKPGVRIYDAQNIESITQRIKQHGANLWRKQ